MSPWTAFFSALLAVVSSRSFPPRFKFGAATSAYQIEGSYNISESIWHHFTHLPGKISDGGTGDKACDSYRLWEEDIRIAKELGLDFYRFSISWPRLLPTGFPNHISEDGKNYYSNLIDGLLEKGIEPVVTLYHWDLPQRLQDHGGWSNPLISDWFASYARVAFTLFGDRIGTWLTINEPTIFCDLSHNVGIMAPGIVDPQFGNFLCNKHALMAHAKAWRIYDEEFRHIYHGKVSYTDVAIWMEPHTEEDTEIASLANEYGTGLYSHPVYSKEGGWPSNIEKIISEYSAKEGYPWSVLLPFTKEEVELVKGTYDFFGLNYYGARTARRAKAGENIADSIVYGIPPLKAVISFQPEWKQWVQDWFTINFPEGLRKQFNWLKQQYGDLEYKIMEIGFPDTNPVLNDVNRIAFLKSHLEQTLLAIEDGVNVTCFTVWTLIDNFEWMDGYSTKFGLYHVDFESEERIRTPRASAHFYADVIKTKSLDVYTTAEALGRVTDEL